MFWDVTGIGEGSSTKSGRKYYCVGYLKICWCYLPGDSSARFSWSRTQESARVSKALTWLSWSHGSATIQHIVMDGSPEYSNNCTNGQDLPIVKHSKDDLQVTRPKTELTTPMHDPWQGSLALARAELEVEQTDQGLLLLEDALPHDRIVGHGNARLTGDHLGQKLLMTGLIFVGHLTVFKRWLGAQSSCLRLLRLVHRKLNDVDNVSYFDKLKLVHLTAEVQASRQLDQVGCLIAIAVSCFDLLVVFKEFAVNYCIKSCLNRVVESLGART